MATAVVGAVMGVLSYTVGLAVTGNLHQWSLGGALKSAFWGGIGGAVSFGVGSIFSNTAGTLTTFASNLKETIGRVGLAIVQAGTHAVSQGVLSVMQGGDFVSSVAGSFFGSLGASAFGAIAGDFASSAGGTIAFGALSGGIGAELSGGNFWEGAVIGGIVAGLNHSLHKMTGDDPPKGRKANSSKKPWDLDGDGKLSLDEANNWYRNGNGNSIDVDASKIDLNFIDPSTLSYDKYTSVQTLVNSSDGRVYGHISMKLVKGTTNKVTIHPDRYDFEMHNRSGMKTFIRNMATKIGAIVAGKGQSYQINFTGVNTINYIKPIPVTNIPRYAY